MAIEQDNAFLSYSANKTDDTDAPSEQQELFSDDMSGDMEHLVHEPENTRCCNFSTFWSYAGPGWLMAIAYLDPGNLVADLQTGAYTGYQLLWVLLWAVAAGWFCQVLALTIGAVTGKHLAEVCREEYSRPLSYTLWALTEIVIIGNDIQQIIGSAVAFKILFDLPLWAGALITCVDTFTFLGFQYFGIRKLEAFFATLVGTMAVCFFINFGVMGPDSAEIAKSVFVPRASGYATLQLVGLLGSVIMPHNLYLHSASVASRKLDRSRSSYIRESIKYFSIDAGVSLLVAFVVNLAVISVFAKGFFKEECAVDGLAWIVNPENPEGICGEIGLFNAGDVLNDTLKGSARTVWAIGLLAAGQSATMTGTFAGQYVMEGFLKIRLPRWKRIIFTRFVALIPALGVAIIAQSSQGVEDVIDEWINVLQAIELPFALLPVLHFASSRKVMGEFTIGILQRALGWILFFIVLSINFYLVFTEVLGDEIGTPWILCIAIVVLLAYLFVIFHIIRTDIAVGITWVRHWCCQGPRPDTGAVVDFTSLSTQHNDDSAVSYQAVI